MHPNGKDSVRLTEDRFSVRLTANIFSVRLTVDRFSVLKAYSKHIFGKAYSKHIFAEMRRTVSLTVSNRINGLSNVYENFWCRDPILN